MKISKVRIKHLQQFQDLELDLTYPKGHEKEGKPLDKVCIIGQSGTGKTTLLKLLKEAAAINITSLGYRMETNFAYTNHSELFVDFESDVLSYTACIETDLRFLNPHFTKIPPLIRHNNFLDKRDNRKLDESRIPAELDSELQSLVYEGARVMNFPLGFRYRWETNKGDFDPTVVDYGKVSIWDLWLEIKEVLESERNELTARALLALDAKNGERERLMAEVDRWKQENPNMLSLIGKELNPLLRRFFLKVHDDLTDKEVLNRFEFIPLKHIQTGDFVPYSLLNSGSYNVTLIASALFFYKPTHAIIFIDEVENSLYPDVQEEIVNDYVSMAPQSQFFFSTHSPLVASSFDPWEIIELKFDENGGIYQDNYLKDVAKGRHVENYKFNPKMMSWSSIIARIYDLEKDGPKERQEALSKLAFLEEQMNLAKNSGEKIDSQSLNEFIKLGESLDWQK